MVHVLAFCLAVLSRSPQVADLGQIQGTIVDTTTQQPIEGARVSLSRWANLAAPPSTPVMVTTDVKGGFSFRGIAADAYRLVVTANGYARKEYGQRSLTPPGSPVNLAAGQSMTGIVVSMIPTGSINGRVKDDRGQPAVGIMVQASRIAYEPTGRRTVQVFESTTTDDHGNYRLFWLTPGRYFAVAGPPSGSAALQLADRAQLLNIPITIAGNLNSILEEYGVAFYPSAADSSNAVSIDVASGNDVGGIDIVVPRYRTLFTIKGKVVNAKTQQSPGAGSYMTIVLGAVHPIGLNQRRITFNVTDGTFEIVDVPPGSYILESVNNSVRGLPRGLQSTVVSNSNVDVVVNLFEGVTLNGRLTVEGSAPASVPGFERMIIALQQSEESMPSQSVPLFGGLNPDGTFTQTSLFPGSYRVRVFPLPLDYYVKSVTFDSLDALSRPLQFITPVPSGLNITLSPKGARIDGLVLDDKQQPAVGCQVVLVPRAEGRIDLYKTATTDTNGQYSIRGVTPGEYKVFVWEGLEPFSYFDPSVVAKYDAMGKAVRLSESEEVNINLNFVTLP